MVNSVYREEQEDWKWLRKGSEGHKVLVHNHERDIHKISQEVGEIIHTGIK